MFGLAEFVRTPAGGTTYQVFQRFTNRADMVIALRALDNPSLYVAPGASLMTVTRYRYRAATLRDGVWRETRETMG